jgi:hypothetical protein
MQLIRLQSFYTVYFLLVSISSAHFHDQRQPLQARDIFSPIESLADSILGITTTQSAEQTAAAASTTTQTATTQDDSTTTATPQAVTVLPTAAATSSSSQTSASETSSDAISGSTAILTAQPITSSSTSQTPSPSSPLTSSTLASPANPIQGLSSGSAGSSQVKQDNGNSVSAAGLAVAVLFGVLILAGVAYLLYRHFRSAREKAATLKPSNYNELKRYSYFDHDAERGLAHNPGLGLGRMATLRSAPDITPPYNAQPYRTRSRAGSEDTLVSETIFPVLPLDRRESPLPPLPKAAQESWPMISPVDNPYPQSLLVTIPTARTPSGKARTSYTPYRREVKPVIGLAVPLNSSYTQTAESLGPALPSSGQTREVAASEKTRQLSGVHELS